MPGEPAGTASTSPEGNARNEGEGGCLCGAVRFRVTLPPRWIAHCHCSMCRRAHGAGFVTWFGVDRDRFTLLGATPPLQSYRSSADAQRKFCSRCGTPLLFESKHWPDETHVTLASLDPAVAATLTPQLHSYWSSRAPWIGAMHDGLPRKDPEDHA